MNIVAIDGTYYYSIVAVNAVGNSSFSNNESITVLTASGGGGDFPAFDSLLVGAAIGVAAGVALGFIAGIRRKKVRKKQDER